MTKPDSYRIIFTRALDKADLEYARRLGLDPVCVPMLRIKFPDNMDEARKQLMSKHIDAWIFTSRNGVKGMQLMQLQKYDIPTPQYVFAVGQKTAGALKKIGLKAQIPVDSRNAKGLGARIAGYHDIRMAVHFTGNRHRPELKEVLQNAGIELIELIVYRTETEPASVSDAQARAIVFYSPSAVETYVSENSLDNMTCFAIGPTTAGSLRENGAVRIIQAEKPDTRLMLELVSNYLEKNGRTQIIS